MRGRWGWALLPAAIAWAICAACTAFDAAPAAPAADAQTSDAATTSDVATTPVDGGDATPPPSASFCATRTPSDGGFTITYCADYDEGVVGTSVQGPSKSPGDASTTYDDARASSPPLSAHVSFDNALAGTAGAAIDIPLTGTVTRVRVSYDMYLNPSTDTDHTIGLIQTGGSCSYYAFAGVNPGAGSKMRLQEHAPAIAIRDMAILATAVTRESWHHVTWDFDLISGGVVLANDGDSATGQMTKPLCTGQRPSLVRVGIPFGTGSVTHDGWFDNVVVETKQ